MKKISYIISALFTLVCLVLPAATLAVDVLPVCTGPNAIDSSSAVCRDNATNSNKNPIFGPDGIMTTVISLLSLIVGVIAVIVIMIAAIRFMTSQGNPQTVNAARNTIIYAAVAIAVSLVAQGIVVFVLKKL